MTLFYQNNGGLLAMDMCNSSSMSLLVYLTCIAGCDFLSDLRFLDFPKKLRLAAEVGRIPVSAGNLREWNDMLTYLGETEPRHSRDEAKEILVDILSGHQSHKLRA